MIRNRVQLQGFRSITEPVDLPFNKKITFLAGQNNVGKSNILRALAILANKQSRAVGDKYLSAVFTLTTDSLTEKLSNRPHALRSLKLSAISSLDIEFRLHSDRIEQFADSAQIQAAFPEYFNTRQYHTDYGNSGSLQANIHTFVNSINISDDLSGSTYVPHLRFITRPGEDPPHFLNEPFPGETIAFGTVIERLAKLDRPPPTEDALKSQLTAIQNFLAYCLEANTVTIEVAYDKKSITVDIDGERRSLDNLGTGVEHLLMVGLASMGFNEKLVLIDEPELHLHPRAQKRMLTYLNTEVDASFIIATHSAAVLDSVDADIIQVSRRAGQSKTRTINSRERRFELVRDLGHSPSELVQTRFAIWVEGPSDRIYLNYWISKIDGKLIEGADYTILFYGGSILSQHTYRDIDLPDEAPDLVRALSISRSFAVVIDSDLTLEKTQLRETKVRIREEVIASGGYCWITDGREVENYLGPELLRELAKEFDYVSVVTDKLQQVLDPKRASKVAVAHRAVELTSDTWPLDLKLRVEELVCRIREAA